MNNLSPLAKEALLSAVMLSDLETYLTTRKEKLEELFLPDTDASPRLLKQARVELLALIRELKN